MRKTAVAGAVLALATTVYAQTAEEAFGVWENPSNKSHTEFYKCGGGICGKIVRVVDGQKTDDKNPDPAKRSRAIVGLVIMEGKKVGPVHWSGTLYNPADGKSYFGAVTVTSKNALDLSHCVGRISCETTTLTRVK
jgi:uncharacterized protein (DUF2147 family)